MQQRIKNITQHIILKKLTSVLILCTLLVSITPKRVLHSFTAHHKDESAKKINDRDKLQFNSFGLNCDCNNVVATSPFTETATCFEVLKLKAAAAHTASKIDFFSSPTYFNCSLRGPPANG